MLLKEDQNIRPWPKFRELAVTYYQQTHSIVLRISIRITCPKLEH